MIATNQKLLLAAVLGLFLIGGNAEAQTQQQMANRAATVNEWADGGFRQCIVSGRSTKECNCMAAGMRQTPFNDIAVVLTLIEHGLSTENAAAFKHVEGVAARCLKNNR